MQDKTVSDALVIDIGSKNEARDVLTECRALGMRCDITKPAAAVSRLRAVDAKMLCLIFGEEAFTWEENLFHLHCILRSTAIRGFSCLVAIFSEAIMGYVQAVKSIATAFWEQSLAFTMPWLTQSCFCMSLGECSASSVAQKSFRLLQHLYDPCSPVDVEREFRRSFAELSPNTPNSSVTRRLMAFAAPAFSSLRELSFRDLMAGDLSIVALSGVVWCLPLLDTLDLHGNGVYDHGVHVLCRSLADHCNTLRVLDVSDNKIALAGAADLFFLAETCDSIEDIDVEKNPIYSSVWKRRIHDVVCRNVSQREAREERVRVPLPASPSSAVIVIKSTTLEWRGPSTSFSVALPLSHPISIAMNSFIGSAHLYRRNIPRFNGATISVIVEPAKSPSRLDGLMNLCVTELSAYISDSLTLQFVIHASSLAPSFFVEVSYVLVPVVESGGASRIVVKGKSCPRWYAENIDRYGGSLGPEIAAVLEAIASDIEYDIQKDAWMSDELRYDEQLESRNREISAAVVEKWC
jgi:hypothetical protein